MNIQEKIGQFYLGSDIDLPELAINYDAKDLTTHAVIVGMTGSGKTGLGICLLEEAALDGIPVIAIDPKGDMGNLALNFPELRPEDFKPWADPATLAQQGLSTDEWATQIAQTWRKGITESGQSPARMQALKDASPVTIYTPGSNNGVPLSLLADLAPPDATLRGDSEAYGETLDACASALLALTGDKSDSLDPIHIFLTQILRHHWDKGQTLSLADLIKAILRPPFKELGVMPLDDVISDKTRKSLATSFNSLLASPSFSAWTQGAPLDSQNLLFDAQQRPQTAVLNIAHLSEDERMFFVTLLLSNLISWMRQQSGTGTLRAILYMDEIFGYLPPTANPPSKQLLLTLLKQARAYGLGLVLSTQNPIDLDYKALSNAGTWFVGRLQTAQDRARLRDGLLAASPGAFSSEDLDAALNQLGKRTFLLHNVHENVPCLFHTRWAMSYLAGPLDKARLALLKPEDSENNPAASTAETPNSNDSLPILPDGIGHYYAPLTSMPLAAVHYRPWLLARATLYFKDRTSNTQHEQSLLLATDAHSHEPDWSQSLPLNLNLGQLNQAPNRPAIHDPAAVQLSYKKTWQETEKALKTYLRQQHTLELYYAADLKTYSEPGEDEASFRNRLMPIAREARDADMDAIRERYARKQATLEKQLLTAENQLATQKSQSTQSWIDAGISIGGALLGAFTGRSNRRNTSTALRRASRIGKERQDVAAAEAKLALIEQQVADLEAALEKELDDLRTTYDTQSIALTTRSISATSRDIQIDELAVLYRPE
ncbi:DUF87 domain-containing protein [Cardiobacteriaceae bacterium TAE3-ERU3]|nr:DUF87 domain-containing protein [Cardiobacteriaceae bacterium TAE3-ERU3]